MQEHFLDKNQFWIKMKKGIFVAFEGIDGSGKSTQTWLLGKHLAELNKYNHIIMTREPWKDMKIRKILTQDKDPYSKSEELAKRYVEDRKSHVKKLIEPNLKKGISVITDRYSLSTLSYQQAQGISLKKLLKMHKGLLIPNIIFLIDVPVNIVLKRMTKDKINKHEQKFEANKDFIEKLRKNYLKLKELPNHKIIVIDGTKKPQEIFEKQIKPAFNKLYNQFVSN